MNKTFRYTKGAFSSKYLFKFFLAYVPLIIFILFSVISRGQPVLKDSIIDVDYVRDFLFGGFMLYIVSTIFIFPALYFGKYTQLKESNILISDNIIQYVFLKSRSLGVTEWYYFTITDITKVSETNTNIVINAKIERELRTDTSSQTVSGKVILNSIKIPKVFENMDELILSLKELVGKKC